MCLDEQDYLGQNKAKTTQAKGKTPQLLYMGLKDVPFDSSSDGNYRQ